MHELASVEAHSHFWGAEHLKACMAQYVTGTSVIDMQLNPVQAQSLLTNEADNMFTGHGKYRRCIIMSSSCMPYILGRDAAAAGHWSHSMDLQGLCGTIDSL